MNAGEREILFVQDEKSDVQTSLAGYDLADFYLAPAWIAGFGDGFYVHTILFGAFPGQPPASIYKVVFRFVSATGPPVVRGFETRDGTTFTSDFEVLDAHATGDQAEIARAFVSFAGSGLGPATAITSLVVESYADGELRDRAPGGVYAPAASGAVEVPGQGASRQVVPSWTPGTPSGYVTASFASTGTRGDYVAQIRNLLKKGAQHAHLELPRWAAEDPAESGWRFESMGDMGGELKPNATLEVGFRLVPVGRPDGSVPPMGLNVTSDIGGRAGFQVALGPGGSVIFLPETEAKDWMPGRLAPPAAAAPGAAGLAAIASLAMVAVVVRRRP